jgi:hypothetical protein
MNQSSSIINDHQNLKIRNHLLFVNRFLILRSTPSTKAITMCGRSDDEQDIASLKIRTSF